MPIHVFGTYADGTKLYLSNSTQTGLVSQSTGIATVSGASSSGPGIATVTAAGVGGTSITVSTYATGSRGSEHLQLSKKLGVCHRSNPSKLLILVGLLAIDMVVFRLGDHNNRAHHRKTGDAVAPLGNSSFVPFSITHRDGMVFHGRKPTTSGANYRYATPHARRCSVPGRMRRQCSWS